MCIAVYGRNTHLSLFRRQFRRHMCLHVYTIFSWMDSVARYRNKNSIRRLNLAEGSHTSRPQFTYSRIRCRLTLRALMRGLTHFLARKRMLARIFQLPLCTERLYTNQCIYIQLDKSVYLCVNIWLEFSSCGALPRRDLSRYERHDPQPMQIQLVFARFRLCP